jgi:murein DD-endopeptidase MepM/ murein hydrolase activator NlpD
MDEHKQNSSPLTKSSEKSTDLTTAPDREIITKNIIWKKTHQSFTTIGLAVSVGTATIFSPNQHHSAVAFNSSISNSTSPAENESISINGVTPESQEINLIYAGISRFWQERQEASLKHLQKRQQRLLDALVTLQRENAKRALLLDYAKQAQPFVIAQLKLDKLPKPSKKLVGKDLTEPTIVPPQLPLTNSVAADAQTVTIPVNTSTIANTNTQKGETLPLPSALDVSNPTLLTSFPIQIYQVQAGDTIDTIARRYGVSSAEIIEINNIDNPKLLQVDDRLKIPPSNTTQQPSANPNLVLAVAQTNDSLPLNKSELRQPISSSENDGFKKLTKSVTTSSVSLSNRQPNDKIRAATDPYLAKLRADIVKLQQDYRNQLKVAPLDSANLQGDRSDASDPPLLAPPSPAASATILHQLNASYLPKNRGLGGTFPSSTKTSVIPVLAKLPETILSSASTSPSNYNQKLKLPAEVLPELPPLSPPEDYLPGDPIRSQGYIWPAKGKLSSGYGWRWGRMHKGIDIAAPVGSPVYAAASGEVVSAGWSSGGYGNLVKVKHSDGSLTFYAHNSKVLVHTGQTVEQGQQIAEMGSTGFSTGPHLHFEIHPTGKGAVNPIAFLPKSRQLQ